MSKVSDNTPLQTMPIDVLAQTLGERLEAYRIARGLKQTDLAERAGIGRATLIRFESGATGTVDTLLRLLRALGLEDRILDVIPDASASPLDPRRAKGLPRQRVRDREGSDTPWTWGDETDET